MISEKEKRVIENIVFNSLKKISILALSTLVLSNYFILNRFYHRFIR